MQYLKDLIYNYILVSAVTSWFLAQILKVIINFSKMGKKSLERFVGSGGMPSSHTALVCAATIAAARLEGTGSSIFAICFIVTCVVMYDALNVRRQAGEHAKVLNKLLRMHSEDTIGEDDELKELLGHTPLEVLGGALLGICVAMFYGILFF